jgi:hypothetical protein
MLVLQKFFLCSLLALLFPQNTSNPKQELNEQLFEAVRKGDAAAVASLLDRGAEINAKFRYGTTALFKAAERGHTDVVKILLDRGADVKVKDTFYGATAMTWALDNDHTEVVRLLLEKDPIPVDDVLMSGVRQSKEPFVKVALDRGGAKPQTLMLALAVSSGNEKNAAIVELLKKAGAVPPPQIEAATLQSYVGKYKGEPGPEVTITVKDGKLFIAGLTREPLALMGVDTTNFRPLAFDGLSFTFNVEGGNVTGLAFKQGPNTTQLKRLAEVKP